MKPALTQEEWKRVTNPGLRLGEQRVVNVERMVTDTGHKEVAVVLTLDPPTGPRVVTGFVGPQVHALAALALHGQPFGFTLEDVTLIKEQIIRWGAEKPPNPALMNLAARIAALLPPEDPNGQG